MISLETTTLFFAASLALALAPGPDNIFVLTQSALHGKKAGIMVTLGLCMGLLVHTTAVALGVAVIFQTSAMAFNILKIAGAVYLLYLAYEAFRAGTTKLEKMKKANLTWKKLYLRGIIMNVTNPKVAVFFLAFLPQFADPSRGSVTIQIMMLGALFIVSTLLVFGTVAWYAGILGKWLQHSAKAQIIMNLIAGTVFIALALKLAVS